MRKKTLFYLGAIILFGLLLRLLFFSGVGMSDSLGYTVYANQWSQGDYEFPKDHHGTRIGIVYPVGFLYSIFGANEFSSNIFSLILSLGTIFLLFLFGKLLFDEKTGLIASFLLAIFPLDIVFGTKLMPDVPSMFFLGLSVYFFLKAEKHTNQRKLYLFSGLSLGISYLLRENAILLLLFFGFYVLFCKKMQIKWEYFLVALGFLILIGVEMAVFYNSTGDPLFRVHEVNSEYVKLFELENYYGRDSFPMLLFHFPFIMFTDIQLGLFFPFFFIALWYCFFLKRKETLPLIIWFVALLAYLSVGTVSFTKYIPFFAAPRYLMIVTLPGILMLAYFLSRKKKIIAQVIQPTVILLLLFTSLGYIYLEESRHMRDTVKQAYPFVTNLGKEVYVDERTRNALQYQSGFTLRNFKIFNHCVDAFSYCTDPESFTLDAEEIKDAYVLVSHKIVRNIASTHAATNFPQWLENPPADWIVVNEIGSEPDSITFYYAP